MKKLILLFCLVLFFRANSKVTLTTKIKNNANTDIRPIFSGTGAFTTAKFPADQFNLLLKTGPNDTSSITFPGSSNGSWIFNSGLADIPVSPTTTVTLTIPFSDSHFDSDSSSFFSVDVKVNTADSKKLIFLNPTDVVIDKITLTKSHIFNFSGIATPSTGGNPLQQIGNLLITGKQPIPIILKDNLSWAIDNITLDPGTYTIDFTFNVDVILDPNFHAEIATNCVTINMIDPPGNAPSTPTPDILTQALINKYRNSDQPVNPRIGCCP
jgi:hypothetical protein